MNRFLRYKLGNLGHQVTKCLPEDQWDRTSSTMALSTQTVTTLDSSSFPSLCPTRGPKSEHPSLSGKGKQRPHKQHKGSIPMFPQQP